MKHGTRRKKIKRGFLSRDSSILYNNGRKSLKNLPNTIIFRPPLLRYKYAKRKNTKKSNITEGNLKQQWELYTSKK
jgi:hypothetical protein